jgi:DeoR family transcriptional regulator of aga operon
VIIAADSSKLGKVSPAFICAAGAIHTLITDTGVSAEAMEHFERLGIQIIRV